MTPCPKGHRLNRSPILPLQITMRTPKTLAFKFELLPLHSPLLGQSLLVSFPPLIDMLKFRGYPYLISGQTQKNVSLMAALSSKQQTTVSLLRHAAGLFANAFKEGRAKSTSSLKTKH